MEVKINKDTYMSVSHFDHFRWNHRELYCRFPVERWLDTKEDDGRISLELEPNKKPASKKETRMCFLQC